MRTFDRSQVDPWFLSGEPVVRLWGRDFQISVERYCDWLLELARNYKLEVQIKKLVDPPGVVVRACLGDEPERLLDPLIVVNKDETPWLFCVLQECSNRLADGMPAGGVCERHKGTH